LHRFAAAEVYQVLSGSGVMTLDGEVREVRESRDGRTAAIARHLSTA
jgi:oxalate decarboxylase/phosphoglucose isomerase-like protein (cupin superfamily)